MRPYRNLPFWDRLLRVLGGLIAGMAAFQASPEHGLMFWSLVALASTLVLSAAAGYCPGKAMLCRRGSC